MNNWLKDNKQLQPTAQHVTSWVFQIGLLMTISAIPFGWSIWQRISLYVLGIGYVSDYVVGCRWQVRHGKTTIWLSAVMLMMFALAPVWQVFDSTPMTDYFRHLWHQYDWFGYVGLVGLIGCYDRIPLRYVAYTMLCTSLVMMGYTGYLYCGTDLMPLYDGLMRWNDLRSFYIHSHMVVDLYLNIALILGFCTIESSATPRNIKWVVLTAMVLTAIFALTSLGRIGVLTTMIILLVSIVLFVWRWRRIWCLPILLAGVVSGVWWLSHNDRMTKEKMANDPRVTIWRYSMQQVAKHPIAGWGLSTLSQVYVEEAYQDSAMCTDFIEPVLSLPWFEMQGRNMATVHPHNAFLMHWLAYGIVGVMVLIALFVTAALLPVGKKNRIYLWLMLLAIFLQSLFEPIGNHLLPQMICLMLLVWQCTIVEVETENPHSIEGVVP